MESPILYILAAIAGLAALEMRRAKMTVLAVAVAFALVAIAMFAAGAVEAGIGAALAGVAVTMVLRWGFAKTVEHDALPAIPGGARGVCVIVGVLLFALLLYVAMKPFYAIGHDVLPASHAGLLREVLVVITALGAIWAMLRKSGRRDE